MYRVNRILLFAIVSIILSSATACAVSYSDADGDGICEPGEEITFKGDPHFDYYDWDFDGDGLPDDNGEEVTYTFDSEGEYLVTVVQTNGHTEEKSLTIEVKSEDSNDDDNDDDNNTKSDPVVDAKIERFKNKIKKILKRFYRRHMRIHIIIKLLVKFYNKFNRKNQNDLDYNEFMDYIKEQIRDHSSKN